MLRLEWLNLVTSLHATEAQHLEKLHQGVHTNVAHSTYGDNFSRFECHARLIASIMDAGKAGVSSIAVQERELALALARRRYILENGWTG